MTAPARPRVLLVEDEPSIADNVVYALETEGFAVTHVTTGGEALARLRQETPALIVLDVGLPDGNGFELCKTIRRETDVPVIFMTARAAEIDRIVGLEIGGDDYMVKPVSPRELAARVKAVLRRSPPTAPETARALEIDSDRMTATFRGQRLDLTRYEFRLLAALAAQPGRVFTRDQLMDAAWEDPGSALDRTVDAHIKTLRAKLRAIDPEAEAIVTHRGTGYSLHDPL